MKTASQIKRGATRKHPTSKKKLRQAFHAAGMRLTKQRLAIYRELESRVDHPAVQQLYLAVKPRMPQISLFTVYRTMNALEAAGMVLRVATWKSHARYDATVAAHAHFLCETCGRIDDVDDQQCPDIMPMLVHGVKGTINRMDIMMTGQCAECAANAEYQAEDAPALA